MPFNDLVEKMEVFYGTEKVISEELLFFSKTRHLVSGGLKMNVGTFSNKVKEIAKVPEVAVALDDSQYLLCIAISDMIYRMYS